MLEVALRLTHPLMPFITEELWQTVAPLANAKTTPSIMLAPWPVADAGKINAAANSRMDAFRTWSTRCVICAAKWASARPSKRRCSSKPATPRWRTSCPTSLLARLTEGSIVAALPEDDAPVAISGDARLMLKVEVDKAAETARLTKEQGKAEAELAKLTAKLEKPGYVDKAPAHLVERDKAQLAELNDKLDKIKVQLAKLA